LKQPMLLRIISRKSPDTWKWDRQAFSRFTSGQGKNAINGAWYLGYPFGLKGNAHRNALAPLSLFTLEGTMLAGDAMGRKDIQAILASFWLLAMLGSCGTRSRRGFGSLQARGWRLDNSENSPLWRSQFEQLVSTGQANSPETWREELNRGLLTLAGWFAPFPDQCAHPHIGSAFAPVLLPGCPDWQSALALAGEKMQRFRRRRQPDYERVLRAMEQPDRRDHKAPQRVTFGLPLTFRFSSLRGHQLTYYPNRIYKDDRKPPDRFASPLYIKIIRLGMRFHPLCFVLQGLQPGKAIELRSKHVKWKAGRDEKFPKFNYYSPVDHSALDEFYKEISKENVA